MSLTVNGKTFEQLPSGEYVDLSTGQKLAGLATRSKGVKRDLLKITHPVVATVDGETVQKYVQLNITCNMSSEMEFDGAIGASRATSPNNVGLVSALLDAVAMLTGYVIPIIVSSTIATNLSTALTRAEQGLFVVPEEFTPVDLEVVA